MRPTAARTGVAGLGGDLAVGHHVTGTERAEHADHRLLERRQVGHGTQPRVPAHADVDARGARQPHRPHRRAGLDRGRGRHRAGPGRRADGRAHRLEGDWPSHRPRTRSKGLAPSASTTCWCTVTCLQVPIHHNVLPLVERVLDPGCLLSSLSSIGDRPRTRRRSRSTSTTSSSPSRSPTCGVQLDVGATDFTEANGATRPSCPRPTWGRRPTSAATTTRSRPRWPGGASWW